MTGLCSVMRRRMAYVLLAFTFMHGCGNGGGGGNGTPGAATRTAVPTTLRTRTPTPPGGRTPTPDARTATPAARTPTPGGRTPTPGGPTVTPGQGGTPTPTFSEDEIIYVYPGENISDAMVVAPAGGLVIVAPGTYEPFEIFAGELQGPLTVRADLTGEITESPPAPVTIVARSGVFAGIGIYDQNDLVIEGFTVRGGTDAAILVVGGSRVTVRDSTTTRSAGDGIWFQDSIDGLVFNNIVTDNAGVGVSALGTTNLRILSNTVYKNASAGFYAGTGTDDVPATATELKNNIFDANTPVGIVVDETSAPTYVGHHNLNTTGYDGVQAGAGDVSTAPQFVAPNTGAYYLGPGSPALDRGDAQIAADLLSYLLQRTTQASGATDQAPVDLGYHYPAAQPTPTKKPRATQTPTARATATRTSATPPRTATATPRPPATATPTVPGPPPTRTRQPRPTRPSGG